MGRSVKKAWIPGFRGGHAFLSSPKEVQRSPAFIRLLVSFQVDLFQLQVNTLRRYKRHYKLQTRPGLNKAQLAEVTTTQIFAEL